MKKNAFRGLLVAAVLASAVATVGAAGRVRHVEGGCPPPAPCTTGGPSCWVVNVKYHSNHQVGGPPEYATYDLWVPGMAFEVRADAECAALRLAVEGVWLPAWFPEQVPENDIAGAYLVPPSRLDAVTLTNVYARGQSDKPAPRGR